MKPLETDRLVIRQFSLHDAPFIIDLHNSDGWIRHIGKRKTDTLEEAKAYLQDGPIRSYRQHGFGLCMTELKFNRKPLGMCGLVKREFLDAPDIGFAFLADYCGKGYAFEASTAVLTYAMDELKFPKVYAITSADNEKAIKLLKKLAMQEIEPVSFPGSDEALKRFVIGKQ